MTARDYCVKMALRIRWLRWAPVAWWLIGGVLYILFGESVVVPIVFFSGLLLIFIIHYRQVSKFLCPFCGTRLSRLLPDMAFRRFPSEISHLPCCGHDMEETAIIINNDKDGNPYTSCPGCKNKAWVNFGDMGDQMFLCENCGQTGTWASGYTAQKEQLEQQFQNQEYNKLRPKCSRCKKEFNVEQLRNPPLLLTLITYPLSLIKSFIVGQKYSIKYCKTCTRKINVGLFFVVFIIAMILFFYIRDKSL